MNLRTILFLFLTLELAALGANAQKVKYKDLILLLTAKRYDEAEPFLKKFIKDHNDNPNAYLYMGILYQEKSLLEDVLRETDLIASHCDSALINYEVANKTIDEREVRRNDEYYQTYSRRDIRTGEFGVTLSDVKLDIEKRMKSVKERKENVKKLKEQYVTTERLYTKSIERFKVIKGNAPENKFYLLADSSLIKKLKGLFQLFDSVTTSFQNYKQTLKLIGKAGYNQSLSLEEIKSFEKDGIDNTDFLKEDLKLWDFKSWTSQAINRIDNDITPLKAALIKTDVAINLLGEKIRKDSTSVLDKLETVIPKSMINTLSKYDTHPLPLSLFNLKLNELSYLSTIIKNKSYKDSTNLHSKIRVAQEELRAIKKVDSTASALQFRDLEADLSNYSDFVTNAYGNVSVIKSLVNAMKEFSTHEIQLKQKELESRSSSLKWLLVGSDSVPLSTDISNKSNKMLIVKPDQFTVGLKFGADSLATGYFYTITPSRVPDVSVPFPVDRLNFKKIALPVTKGLSATDGKGQIFFAMIYSEEKVKGKFPLTIAKIYRSDGLAWSFNYMIDNMPSELVLTTDTGELSIKTASATGEIKIIGLDKNGKIVKQ